MNYNITAKNTRLIVNDGEMAVDVNKADLAQLLSAAPELLVALKDLLHWAAIPSDGSKNAVMLRDQAIAAIAKAEGK